MRHPSQSQPCASPGRRPGQLAARSEPKKNNACPPSSSTKITVPNAQGHLRPLSGIGIPDPKRSSGSVNTSSCVCEPDDGTPKRSSRCASPAFPQVGAVGDAAAPVTLPPDGSAAGAAGADPPRVRAAAGGWADSVANASNTAWQRPQRTWPLEAWSCSRETRKCVWQVGQRVYMLMRARLNSASRGCATRADSENVDAGNEPNYARRAPDMQIHPSRTTEPVR